MAFQLSGCQLPPGPLMSLKTINRESIFLMLTDWSVGTSYHVRLEEHQGPDDLTWLHKSGHWVLCGEAHWLGCTPVQSRYWCLRKGDRDSVRVTERCGCLTPSTLQHRSDPRDSLRCLEPQRRMRAAHRICCYYGHSGKAVSSWSSYYGFTFKPLFCCQ